MNTKYIQVLASAKIDNENKVDLRMHKERHWDSTGDQSARTHGVFVMQGEARKGCESLPVCWKFIAREQTKPAIEHALTLIDRELQRIGRSHVLPHFEMTTEIESWLSVGWRTFPGGKVYGFATFKKDGAELEVHFPDLASLARLMHELP